jgi:hypothetical protein
VSPFTKEVRDKGYTLRELRVMWGIPERKLARIAANPTPRDWAAIRDGLPPKPSTRGTETVE